MPPNYLQQAEKEMKSGNKLITKSLFRWKPNYLMGASHFEKAAKFFRLAKAPPQQIAAAFDLAATCQANIGALDKAGGYLLNGAKEMRLVKSPVANEVAQEYLKTAINHYRTARNDERLSDCYFMLAEILEEIGKVDEAMDMQLNVFDAYKQSEREMIGMERFRRVYSNLLRSKRYGQALDCLQKMIEACIRCDIPHYLHKFYAEMVILLIYVGDTVLAEAAFFQHIDQRSYSMSREAEAIETLLKAAKDTNFEDFEEARKLHTFTSLTNQVSLLLRKIDPEFSGVPITGPMHHLDFPDVPQVKELTQKEIDQMEALRIEEQGEDIEDEEDEEDIVQPTVEEAMDEDDLL